MRRWEWCSMAMAAAVVHRIWVRYSCTDARGDHDRPPHAPSGHWPRPASSLEPATTVPHGV
jgi:hypothetical protein